MTDAASLVTRVHRGLGAEGCRTVFDAPPQGEPAASRADGVGYCFARPIGRMTIANGGGPGQHDRPQP